LSTVGINRDIQSAFEYISPLERHLHNKLAMANMMLTL